MANAIAARPVGAVAFLRICAAIRFDPTPELLHPIPEPSDFDFGVFSLAFRLRRYLMGHNEKQAAKALGVFPGTIRHLERGDVALIGVVLRGCQFVGLSPFGYFKLLNTPATQMRAGAHVSRETSPKMEATHGTT
jgi:hypothetical protein